MGAAKKGALGATKVKTNFADLETQANMADQQKVPEKIFTEEEQAETINSVRLAYQDLSLKAQKQEEKMKHIDPAKAKQMERLGMGFNVRGNVSHSVLTDMKTIAQEPTPSAKFNTSSTAKVFEKEPKMDYFDDYSTSMYSSPSSSSLKSGSVDPDLVMMGFETIEPIESRHSNVTSMFSSSSTSSSISPNRNMNNNNNNNNNYRNSSSGGFGSSSGDGRSRNNKSSMDKQSYNTYENTDAQKKFGGAKAISSDQFFGEETSSFERSANLAKFQGSNSISSAEYFGDKSSSSSRGGMCSLCVFVCYYITHIHSFLLSFGFNFGITPLNRQCLDYINIDLFYINRCSNLHVCSVFFLLLRPFQALICIIVLQI